MHSSIASLLGIYILVLLLVIGQMLPQFLICKMKIILVHNIMWELNNMCKVIRVMSIYHRVNCSVNVSYYYFCHFVTFIVCTKRGSYHFLEGSSNFNKLLRVLYLHIEFGSTWPFYVTQNNGKVIRRCCQGAWYCIFLWDTFAKSSYGKAVTFFLCWNLNFSWNNIRSYLGKNPQIQMKYVRT